MTAATGKSVKLTAKGQRTRQRIVEAAGRLIGRHGVARITLDDVRAEAAVSSSQIYHYFVDKQSLISAVVDHHDSLSVGQASMVGGFESAEAMRIWAHRLIERQRESHSGGGCPIATLGSGLADMDGETHDPDRSNIPTNRGHYSCRLSNNAGQQRDRSRCRSRCVGDHDPGDHHRRFSPRSTQS